MSCDLLVHTVSERREHKGLSGVNGGRWGGQDCSLPSGRFINLLRCTTGLWKVLFCKRILEKLSLGPCLLRIYFMSDIYLRSWRLLYPESLELLSLATLGKWLLSWTWRADLLGSCPEFRGDASWWWMLIWFEPLYFPSSLVFMSFWDLRTFNLFHGSETQQRSSEFYVLFHYQVLDVTK